jgi:hypothetical protein
VAPEVVIASTANDDVDARAAVRAVVAAALNSTPHTDEKPKVTDPPVEPPADASTEKREKVDG